MRTKEELTELYYRHCALVYHICYPFFMNPADTEDAVQETFLHLMRTGQRFRDEDHERAWLIVTARNICRDELRRARRREIPLTAAEGQGAPETEESETLLAIQALPEKYRQIIYLYYYKGYPTARIAQILHKTDSGVRSDLRRARSLLKKRLGGI